MGYNLIPAIRKIENHSIKSIDNQDNIIETLPKCFDLDFFNWDLFVICLLSFGIF